MSWISWGLYCSWPWRLRINIFLVDCPNHCPFFTLLRHRKPTKNENYVRYFRIYWYTRVQIVQNLFMLNCAFNPEKCCVVEEKRWKSTLICMKIWGYIVLLFSSTLQNLLHSYLNAASHKITKSNISLT